MIVRFLNFIETNSLFKKTDSLLLALSGGSDSVALFHLLVENAYTFSVAHMNYSLRGNESDEDADFVASLCAKYNIHLHIKKIDSNYWKRGMNTQAEARKLRYAFFDELSKEYGYSKILTAHHKDDNTETILMNIVRGTGIKGLMGIEKLNENIIRPLLFTERIDVIKYLEENDFDWREDSSNSSDKYKRNRFRNEIIPLLKKENPSLNIAIERLVENLEKLNNSYNFSLKDFEEKNITSKKGMISICTNDEDLLSIYLYDIIKDYHFNNDQVKSIISSIDEVGNYFLSKSHKLYIDRKELIIVENEEEYIEEFVIEENTTSIKNPLTLTFTTLSYAKLSSDEKVELFDKKKLQFPLILRNWREGDRIQPLGMKGSKKISDVFIDKKISRAEKKKIVLLLSGDEVIWIPGLLISEKVKVDKNTSEYWRIKIED